MNHSISLLVLVVCFLYASAKSNRAFPPKKVLRLALAASKDSYLPPLANLGVFGVIKGNWDTMPKLPSVLIGTLSDTLKQPNVFSVLPKQIYNPLFDWPVCKTWWWSANWHAGKKSKVLMLKNNEQKVVVFGFRGTEAYSLKAMGKNFIANISENSAHKEFHDLYNDIAAWFEEEYKKTSPNFTVVVAGYDTGGPQAYIAALKAGLSLGRRPDAVITFGSLTVGDLEFREQYRTHVGCKNTLSVITILDIFSRFPVGAIRPCVDTPVDSGPRPVNKATEFVKNIFMTAFPKVLPQVIQTLLPQKIEDGINKIVPLEKQSELMKNTLGTVDELYNKMLDMEYSHNLYQGYEHGIKELYNGKDIDYGCDKKL